MVRHYDLRTGGKEASLELAVAAEDAKRSWQTGEIPLRPTPRGDQPVSKKRFWQCTQCGGIVEKQASTLEVVQELAGISGDATCGLCGATHSARDVYGGKLDLAADDSVLYEMKENPSQVRFKKRKKRWYYKGQPLRLQSELSEKKEGCFVATVCYGSYDCWQVLVFRKFRDSVLLSSRGGTLFVKLYYTVSPSFTRFLAQKPALKNWIREHVLDPVVGRLVSYFEQSRGHGRR